MKIVRKENPDLQIDLPTIHLTTKELLEVIQKTVPDKKIEFIIGERFDDSYTILESFEEIQQHQSTITIPFTFLVDGVTVKFRRYGVVVSYKKENEVLAISFANRLSEFKPWYLFIFKWWFPALWLVPFWVFLFGDFAPIQFGALTTFILIAWILPALTALFGWSLDRPRIHPKERQGIFQRNADKIFMLLLSVALGVLVANFEKVGLLFNEQTEQEDQQDQPKQ